MSTRLVAARMMTPLLVPKPSISVSNWFNVFSRSSLPPMAGFLPRARPTASISSMKMIHGAFSLAWRNRSRTRLAPTPTNISTKSEPEREKNGTLASPATALANNVLPVPGGPTSKAPLGILPPRSVNFFGFLRNSTISSTSILAPACPATSLKVTLVASPFSISLALLLPTLNTLPPVGLPPPIRLMMNTQMAIMKSKGKKFQKILLMKSLLCSKRKFPLKLLFARASSTRSISFSLEAYSTVTIGTVPIFLKSSVPNTSFKCSFDTYISNTPLSFCAMILEA